MALLTLQKGISSNLNNVAKKDGQLLITTDTKKIYLDNGTKRLPLNSASYAHYSTSRDQASMKGKYYKINITNETSWMLAFTVRLYNNYKFYDINISGYNFGTNHWYSPTAKLTDSTENSIEVTFGYDADWQLWICIPAGGYTGLDIFNVTNGFTQIDLFKAFSISLVDAIPATVQSTQLIYRPWKQNDDVTAYNALMLTNARTFQIADNSETNKGPTASFDGTANVIIKLPSTIKASITGNAATATTLSSTLTIDKGGTGATTAAAALTNLGITATATELNYTDGVTSNIQTQLNNKLPLAGGQLTGDLTFSTSNNDRNISFLTTTTHHWRIQYTGSGSGNANYFKLQSTKTTTDTWSDALRIGCVDHDATFGGAVTATSFSGSGASLTSLKASNISSGTLPIARGGTGATTAAAALTKLGAAATNHTHTGMWTSSNLTFSLSGTTLTITTS